MTHVPYSTWSNERRGGLILSQTGLDAEGVAAGADPPEAGLGAEEAVVEADAGSPEAWPETNEVFLLP